MGAEYYGAVLFQSCLSEATKGVSNNDDGFTKIYLNELMKNDAVLHDLVNKPIVFNSFEQKHADDKSAQCYYAECQELRPGGDYYYSPLFYRSELVGYWGHVRPPDGTILGKREEQLVNIIIPVLNNGISSFILEEKIRMLTGVIEEGGERGCIFITSEGDIDFSSESSGIIGEALHVEQISRDSVLNHPVIKEMYNAQGSILSLAPVRTRTIKQGGRGYLIHLLDKRTCPGGLGLDAVFVVEREKPVYDYQLFGLQNQLTKRELEVVKLIVSGKSNRLISCLLSISEQTVKRHIANIFEKTGKSSRTQLVFSLAGCSTPASVC